MNPIELLQRVSDHTETQIAAVEASPEQPTACENWNAQQLAAHVINSLRFNTELLEGGTPSTAPFDAPDIAPEDLLAQYRDAAAGLLAQASLPGTLERMVNHPVGEMPGAQVLMFPTFDTYVHAWDLEQATGLGQEFPDDLTAAIDGFCQQAFAGERNPDVIKGPTVAPANADAMGRLAAFLGRTVQ